MEAKAKVLVVDDNREIRELLTRHLEKEGLQVEAAGDAATMWRRLATNRVNLIVLDLMLPDDDGLNLCRKLRADQRSANIPIIMLTAKGDEIDRILGLEMGADDYLAKPFSARELLARIRAILRRTSAAEAPRARGRYRFAGWTFDRSTRQLESADATLIPLSSGEYELLLAFVERPAQVLSREQLLDLTRDRGNVPFDRSIDTQVSRLRRKLEQDAKNPQLIKTVWGGGYVFTPEVES